MMSGGDIAQIIEAADTIQAIIILFMIGVFAFGWKYGRELLQLARAMSERTKKISGDIVTNHGSKNLGDAVDRLYEKLVDLQATREIDSMDAEKRSKRIENQIKVVQDSFEDYKREVKPMVEFGRERMEHMLNGHLDEEDQR